MEGKKILVTGAGGLIGKPLVRRLLLERASVTALDWNPDACRSLAREGAEVAAGDVTDALAVRRAMAGCTIVFHCAAILCDFRPRGYYHRVNVVGTETVASLALEERVDRLIHVSSNIAYGRDPGDAVTEGSPRRPFGTPYGDTKLSGELCIQQFIKEARLRAVVVQPTVVYGPFDNLCTRKGIQLASRGLLALPGRGTGIFQPVYVDDLVEGLCLAAVKGRPGESYLLPGPEVVTMRDFYGAVAAMVGSRPPLLVPRSIGLVFGRLAEVMAKVSRRPPLLNVESILLATMRSIYSGAKARREIGFTPRTTMSSGMARVAEWYGRFREKILSSEERVLENGAYEP